MRTNGFAIVTCVVCALIGVAFGKRVLFHRVNQTQFRRIVQFVMLGAGLNLLLFGTSVQRYVSAVLVASVLLAYCAVLVCKNE